MYFGVGAGRIVPSGLARRERSGRPEAAALSSLHGCETVPLSLSVFAFALGRMALRCRIAPARRQDLADAGLQ